MPEQTPSIIPHGTRTAELDAEYAARTDAPESDGRDEAEVHGGAPSMRRAVDTQSSNRLHSAADESYGDTDQLADEIAREGRDGGTP